MNVRPADLYYRMKEMYDLLGEVQAGRVTAGDVRLTWARDNARPHMESLVELMYGGAK